MQLTTPQGDMTVAARSKRVHDVRQGQGKHFGHLRRELLPTHPVLRVPTPQAPQPHRLRVLVDHFQHLEVTAQAVVLILPTELGAQDLVLLLDRFVSIGLAPFRYPA